jgi:hypothetical protein
MPVEIRELVIRAVVTSEAQDSGRSPQVQESPESREALIQECVRQILRILQKKKER